MQRRAFDARAAEADGVKNRRRRDAARAADRELDVADDGFLFLGRILVGDGPARHFARRAELVAVGEIVELHDGAVDVVRQVAAALADGLDGRPDLVRRAADAIAVDRLDALRVHIVIRFRVRRERPPLGRLQIEHEERQLPLLRDAAVELTQRPGRAVARIRERLQSEELLPLVHAVERRLFHIHLAADLEIRQRVAELLHDVRDDARVRRHVLALYEPVAARDGAFELAVAIPQRHRQAVDFFLDDELRRAERCPALLDERDDLVFREHVGERQHRHVMLHEHAGRPHRAAADHLRRRRFRHELRVFLFQRLQPQHELVVFIVRDLGIVFIIIAVVVIADFLAELRELPLHRRDVLCHLS